MKIKFFTSFFEMGRKAKNHKNYKAIIVEIGGQYITIKLDKFENIQDKNDLLQLNPIENNQAQSKSISRRKTRGKYQKKEKISPNNSQPLHNPSIDFDSLCTDSYEAKPFDFDDTANDELFGDPEHDLYFNFFL